MSEAFPTFRYYYSGGTGRGGVWDDGKLLIGSDNGVPEVGSIVAGSGIEITNGPGSIMVTNTQNNTVDGVQTDVEVTTSSDIDIVLEGMVLVPGIGNFLVIFSGTFSNTNKEKYGKISLYRGGVKVPFSNRMVHCAGDDVPIEVSLVSHIQAVSEGEVIDIRWHIETGSTGKFSDRSLMCIRVS